MNFEENIKTVHRKYISVHFHYGIFEGKEKPYDKVGLRTRNASEFAGMYTYK